MNFDKNTLFRQKSSPRNDCINFQDWYGRMIVLIAQYHFSKEESISFFVKQDNLEPTKPSYKISLSATATTSHPSQDQQLKYQSENSAGLRTISKLSRPILYIT